MACLVNSFAFAFPGIISVHTNNFNFQYSKSYIPYRIPNTLSLSYIPTYKQDIALPYVAREAQSKLPQEERVTPLSRKLSPIKAGHIQEAALHEGLEPELMPKHVAIILDGNRGCGKEKHFGRDPLAGGRATKKIVSLCSKWGIKVLSLFAFSMENWARSEEEFELLTDLFEEKGERYMEEMIRNNIRVSVIGDRSKLGEPLQEIIVTGEERSKGNTGLHLVIALNYSGRNDLVQANKSIAGKVKDGFLRVEDINEARFDEELETNCMEYPNPDLLIRTSGEQRISNFFLWQLAYTEIYFSKKNLADFQEEDFIEALTSFQKRERRYGGNMG